MVVMIVICGGLGCGYSRWFIIMLVDSGFSLCVCYVLWFWLLCLLSLGDVTVITVLWLLILVLMFLQLLFMFGVLSLTGL